MAEFRIAYAPLAEFEGGYSNDAGDRGGETYAGIARNFFPNWEGWPIVDRAKREKGTSPRTLTEYLGKNAELKEHVLKWYEKEWWDSLGLGRFPQEVSNEIFEQAVNMGKGGAGKLLQTTLNAFNYNKKTGQVLFEDLTVDGAIGRKTLDALATVLKSRTNVENLVHALNCAQGWRYLSIAAGKVSQRKFTDGWMKRTHG